MGKYNFSEFQDQRREDRRPQPKKQVVKIKRRTPKGAKEDKIYLELRNKYLEEHPVCECCGLNKATEIHHKRGRGVWLLIVKYFLATCGYCHKIIENNPEWAKGNGLSFSRLSKE